MGHFVEKISSLSSAKGSMLVLALDVTGERGIRMLKEAGGRLGKYLVGIKLGVPLVLTTGVDPIKPILEGQSDEFVFIMDAKMADVSHINAMTAEILFGAGFDAIISHGFIGYEGGLDGAREVARKLDRGLLVLVSMSHKASERIIDRSLQEILKEAMLAEPDGLVAPATRPRVISRVRELVPKDMMILSPGVGAQGEPFGSALRAGANYEIVGRAIYESEDPVSTARMAVEEQRKVLSR